MGNKAVSKQARRAAREAAAAAQEEVIRRTKANVEDLAAFFDARDRADAVDEWLAERQQALAEQAAQRRAGQRLQCGTALRAMRDRGETLREIAHGRYQRESGPGVDSRSRITGGRYRAGPGDRGSGRAGAATDARQSRGRHGERARSTGRWGRRSRPRREPSAARAAVSVGVGIMTATGGTVPLDAESSRSHGGFATATAGGRSAGALRGAAAVRSRTSFAVRAGRAARSGVQRSARTDMVDFGCVAAAHGSWCGPTVMRSPRL